MPHGYTYILGSTTGTLYTGVTSNLNIRIDQYRQGIRSGFASKYACHRLLCVEQFEDIRSAISREKQIKGWRREKKLDLIRTLNPNFKDLAEHHGWHLITSQQSIAEEDRNLNQRIKLPLPSPQRK